MMGDNDTRLTAEPTTMQKLQAKAAEREKIVDQIARLLWESGEMLAETEGGSMPTWDEVLLSRITGSPLEDEYGSACMSWWLDHTHRAEALLALDADQALALAQILITQAAKTQKQTELDLWRKLFP